MKVGDKVKGIDGGVGHITRIETHIDGVVEIYWTDICTDGIALNGYLGWQLTVIESAPTPAISLEVSRLKWAWGDEQMWVCEKRQEHRCGTCHHAKPHEKNHGCGGPGCSVSLESGCVPVVPAPSPWRKARIRFPGAASWEGVEIQMEGE